MSWSTHRDRILDSPKRTGHWYTCIVGFLYLCRLTLLDSSQTSWIPQVGSSGLLYTPKLPKVVFCTGGHPCRHCMLLTERKMRMIVKIAVELPYIPVDTHVCVILLSPFLSLHLTTRTLCSPQLCFTTAHNGRWRTHRQALAHISRHAQTGNTPVLSASEGAHLLVLWFSWGKQMRQRQIPCSHSLPVSWRASFRMACANKH